LIDKGHHQLDQLTLNLRVLDFRHIYSAASRPACE
jgi:hypothetical protein